MNGRTATHDVLNQPPESTGSNLFAADPVIQAAAAEFPAEVRADLDGAGAFWGSAEARELAALANRHTPELHRYDGKGRRIDAVEFHPAYHALMRRSVRAGLHSSAWETGPEEQGIRQQARAIRLYITAQGECGHICPMTMTSASLATLRLAPDLLGEWSPRILSRQYDQAARPWREKPGVTLGMGLTEKQGGTDVRANTTRAEPADGGWHVLTGHKWFFSAPASDAFLVVAQAPGGLSCFLVPRLRPDGSLNGMRLERLKDKLGNRSNASAEVEFDDALGTLVGEEGRGLAAILPMVSLTRLDCTVASAGLMRAGLAEAVHHTRHRSVSGKPLVDRSLMTSVLADMALDVAAAAALGLRLAASMDRAADDPAEAAYLRLLTPAVKFWVCKRAPALLAEAMECLGGNGYVEDSLLPRLYREAPVNAIWEGSGNVMALDVVRVLRKGGDTLHDALQTIAAELGRGAQPAVAGLVEAATAAAEDEGAARVFAERLALAAGAGALRRIMPGRVAETFIATRLGGQSGATYGTFRTATNSRALVEELCSPPSRDRR